MSDTNAVLTMSRGHVLEELKNFVELHARAQGLSGSACQSILDSIQSDDGEAGSGWVDVWSQAGAARLRKGDYLDACRHFNMARFPYAEGVARNKAYSECLSAFELWRVKRCIERIEVDVDGAKVVVYAKPGAKKNDALLVVCGGIVSIKEQWAQLLLLADRMDMTVAIAEMPGVGENTMRYDLNSWRMFSAIANQLSEKYGFDDVFLIALSFSGQLALRAATQDARIKGVFTVGAPLHDFFARNDWHLLVPDITAQTLMHLTGQVAADLPAYFNDFAISSEQAKAIRIPVLYVSSQRDEIIPNSEAQWLRENVPTARIMQYDDTHGSPNHLREMRLQIMGALLEARGKKGLVLLFLRALSAAVAVSRHLSRGRH